MRLFRKPDIDWSPEEQQLIAHKGQYYIDRIAATANAKNTYLEVGTRTGASLAPVRCPSIAIDPTFRLTAEAIGEKKVCHLYQMTSDDYFAQYDPKEILGKKLDTVFLDGRHLYEYVLRDFINVEKHCTPDSTIFLHDCLPPTFEMTNRAAKPAQRNYKGCWTGDVWKIVPILRELRPDLDLTFMDCPPTGLVAVTNLNPSSSTLPERYNDIVAAWKESPDDFDKLRAFLGSVQLTPTKSQ